MTTNKYLRTYLHTYVCMCVGICCLLSIEDDTNDVELKYTTYLRTYVHRYCTSTLRKKWNLFPIKCFDLFSQIYSSMSVENDPI